MTWLLLTGAGLVAETVVIVALGRTATARYDAGAPVRRSTQATLSEGIAAGRAAAD
ncbi:hypothetical protein [Blastococcus sp. CT_GayMR20]|uniref:hypothetical protein n=1 Tax=Blastococcus sp. CT_GayMR20 TaxID=2559609 RepID=UPI0014308418|nr:hypothetical protein [Blastococcus sp. CT_GayMR20]